MTYHVFISSILWKGLIEHAKKTFSLKNVEICYKTVNEKLVYCSSVCKPPIGLATRLQAKTLSVTAKTRTMCQNLRTLLLLSAQCWIHLPASVFVQGKSYSNSPSFVYHRLDISPTLHLEVTNKSLDTGSKDCMNSDNVGDERKIKGWEEEE